MTAVTEALAPGGTRFASRSALWLFWQRFKEDKAAVGAAVVIVILILIAIVGGPIAQELTGHANNAGYEATMENSFGLPKGPNAQFWFGASFKSLQRRLSSSIESAGLPSMCSTMAPSVRP